MKIQLVHTYQDIISIENLCLAWQEFLVGKGGKKDVREFVNKMKIYKIPFTWSGA